MKSSEHSIHDVIAAHLHECKKQIDAEVYYKALGALKEAKSADTRNIYIIALEKQVKLLSDLSKKRPVDSVNKKEIEATLPEIIRRAIDDSRKRSEFKKSETNDKQNTDADDNPYIRERELALKKLKSQFIDLAEEFISRGDYQSALEEIRRIFIIDPGNSSARNLEKKIEMLVNYRSTDEVADAKKNGKSKSFKLGKTIPFIIIFLVAANVIIFFLTSMFSDDAPETVAISKSESVVYSSESHIYGPMQEEGSGGSSQTSNSLPDAVMQYREAIAIINEIEDDYTDDVYETFIDSVESTLVEQTETDFTEQVTEPFVDELAYTDTFDVQDPESSEIMKGQIFVLEPEAIVQLEQPVYPIEAIEQGIEGDVVIRILFDAAGTVNVSFVESSDHPILSESALKSARLSRFAPADTAAFDRPQWVTIPYQYRLQ